VSTQWIAVIGTSLIAFALKFIGQSVPQKWLSNPRIIRISALIPIALLSALVAVQSFTEKTTLVVDHRVAGISVAIIALFLKAPFPVVVIAAAATSALVYKYF